MLLALSNLNVFMGQPLLIQGSNILSTGNSYTIEGPFSSGIAYVLLSILPLTDLLILYYGHAAISKLARVFRSLSSSHPLMLFSVMKAIVISTEKDVCLLK
jgi:hypothetical protein